MDVTAETTAIEREISIAASPETVWGFLVDPMKATRWMGQEASFDPRPGGEYRVKVVDETAVGEFVELDPPRRLVFTWGWDPGTIVGVAPGSSTVEIELVPEGDGSTMLRFRHTGLPTEDAVQRHGHGWDHYLPRLQTAAQGDDPGRDPWLDGPMT
jgi:uncharacterized protein YndB with AHSA1/START domain